MTDDKQKARERKRILRRMARESISEKPSTSRTIRGLKKQSAKHEKPAPKRTSKRSPVYGQPVKLELPSLGNRMRGPIQPPQISRHVVDAIRRRDTDRMAAQAVDLAGKMIEESKKDGGTTDTEGAVPTSEDSGTGTAVESSNGGKG